MAKPPRSRQLRTFFVTSVTHERRSLFQSERMGKLFLDVLLHYRTEGRYHLHEFVLMPDHFHLLISLEEGMTVERAVQLVKGGFSFRAGTELSFKGEIWQRGFTNHIVKDFRDFQSHVMYIRVNPVKRKLAPREEEYSYSSAHAGFELDPPPACLGG
ncbi:MAG: transposase [Acidobacteria bacterium]|nr:transposase [Acidobacteriota bacterium]